MAIKAGMFVLVFAPMAGKMTCDKVYVTGPEDEYFDSFAIVCNDEMVTTATSEMRPDVTIRIDVDYDATMAEYREVTLSTIREMLEHC